MYNQVIFKSIVYLNIVICAVSSIGAGLDDADGYGLLFATLMIVNINELVRFKRMVKDLEKLDEKLR